MSSRDSVPTYRISKLLSSMVVLISRYTKIFWRMNVLRLLSVHLEEYWLLPGIKICHWRMWGILFLMNAIRCLNHLVWCPLWLIFICHMNFLFLMMVSVHCCLCLYFWCFADMRRDVQEIFKMTPHDKQVMMFSATLSKEIRPVCKKFMQDVISYGQNYLNLEVPSF